ncbi:hypothetical protein RJ639_030711 [Escallonia herrerae]|uniref:Zinc finger protein n=1 Tax=Escallonia herrerae TaxID=1293975 RepID=A0AA88X1G0_9ASTE|nr:hypothetical protein RJ639_030711 [Escallonia herrerae]
MANSWWWVRVSGLHGNDSGSCGKISFSSSNDGRNSKIIQSSCFDAGSPPFFDESEFFEMGSSSESSKMIPPPPPPPPPLLLLLSSSVQRFLQIQHLKRSNRTPQEREKNMTGKAKPKKHTAKEIASKVDAALTNRGGGKAGLLDRTGGVKGGHAKYECPHCKITAPDVKSMQIHHDSKHPKIPFDESKISNLHATLPAPAAAAAVPSSSSAPRPGISHIALGTIQQHGNTRKFYWDPQDSMDLTYRKHKHKESKAYQPRGSNVAQIGIGFKATAAKKLFHVPANTDSIFLQLIQQIHNTQRPAILASLPTGKS